MNFYDLCCAGEEKKQKFVGNKVVDAGDIKQSLAGYSVIGRGEVHLPVLRLGKGNYRQGFKDNSLVFTALKQAETNLGLGVSLDHARRILVLITSPKDCLSTTVMEEIFGYLDRKAPKAVIRIGDYPRRDRENIGHAHRLGTGPAQPSGIPRHASGSLIKKRDNLRRETDNEMYLMREFSRNIPTLD
jgi:cell division GTPase FtsZ